MEKKVRDICEGYAKVVFAHKIVGFASFFSAIDKFIERGIDTSEIHYQISHNKAAFEKVNKKNTFEIIKKAIALLYKEKYVSKFSDNNALMQMAWQVFTENCISQFLHFGSLTEKCYPGQTLSVTATDVKNKIFPLIK